MECDINLGGTPSKFARRDAIHIPVIPMVAGESLGRGVEVVVKDGVCIRADSVAVGIVDSYRKKGVKKGESFWLMLYPKTILSLRHEWVHPSIPSSESDEDNAARKMESE